MRFTNRFGLPEILLRAATKQNAKYNRGNVHRSVTQLIQAPRIDLLRKKHFAEMEKDLSEEWWALFGSAVHHILEMGRGPLEETEERFFATIDGWALSGACDLQSLHGDNLVSLADYKVTTAFALMAGDDGYKIEWEQQLNMLAYMVDDQGKKQVSDLSIVAIVRDWQRKQSQADPTYPQAPVVQIPVPLWTPEKQMAFIQGRIDAHRRAELTYSLKGELPECSDEERWTRNNSFAVMKDGAKRATKVSDTVDGAVHYLENEIKDKDRAKYTVVFRPGEPVRCKGDYCGVAQWCDQWARTKAQGEDGAE